MPTRMLDSSVLILPPPEDEALARAILDTWAEDLGDMMVAMPVPENEHQDDKGNWWPDGYFGWRFDFLKDKRYVAIAIPKDELTLTVNSPEKRGWWEAKIRTAWKQMETTDAQASE